MSQRIIKVDDKFNPITLPEFYDSPPDDCHLVILSSREKTVIRKALGPMYWRTRFGEFLSPSMFRVSDSGDLVELLENLEGKLMGCDIAESISSMAISQNNIAKAIELLAKSQCCDQTSVIVNVNGGVNGQLPDGSVTYGTTPYSDAPENIPEGYQDAEQFDAQKCAMAHAMVSDVVYVLSVLSGASGVSAVGGLVVAVLGVTAVLAVPQVAIPALIAAVAICVLSAGTLYAVSLEVESHRSEIVCALVSGENLDLIMETLADIIDVIVATVGASSPVGAAIKTVLLIFFNSETLNKLYASYAGFMYPSADCSECEPCDRDYQFDTDPFEAVSVSPKISISGGHATTENVGQASSTWFGESWDADTIVSMFNDIDLSPGVYGYGLTARTVADWQWGIIFLYEWDEESFPSVVATIYPLTTSFEAYTGTFEVTTGTKLLLGMSRGEPSSQYFVTVDSLQIQGDDC